MIVAARTPEERQTAAAVLFDHAGVQPCADMQALVWLNDETQQIEWVVGYTGFIGKVCQVHVVNLSTRRAPRKMLRAAFDYPFNQLGLQTVLGIVNSKNEQAMRFDRHLGFKELMRLEGQHEDGGDLVVFAMDRSECRWIEEQEHENVLVA